MKYRIFLVLGFLFISNSIYSQEKVTKIHLQDLEITINNLVTENKESLNSNSLNEILLEVALGEKFDRNVISIKSTEYINFEIYQAFETSLTIMNEGPHCDLLNWKHYKSEWTKLESINLNSFKSKRYDSLELRKFPNTKSDEILNAIKEHCGENWISLTKDFKSIYDYPFDVGVSRTYLKIKALNKKRGKQIEKIIILALPLGC